MQELAEQLRELHGRIGLLCIGNREGGDDGVGVLLGEQLARAGICDVIIAGVEPERWLFAPEIMRCDHVIFVDAVDFGGAAGSVVFLNSAQMSSRFAQVSTHRLSLGLLAQCVESSGKTRAWLLGIQPESLRGVGGLSPSVQSAMNFLGQLLADLLSTGASAC